MRAYFATRILVSVVLLWVVATVLFFFIHLLPGDPALMILGGEEANPTPEQIVAVRARLGLDRPVWEQYVDYLSGLLRGDLGESFLTHRGVVLDLRLRLVRTLQLVVPSILFSSVAGVLFGVLAAQFRGRWVDALVSTIGLLGHSVPVFVVSSILILIVSIRLELLPSSGYVEFSQDPAAFFRCLALPVITLATRMMATTMRMTRMTMVEEMMMDYVRTARAKGLGERLVIGRHVLRNALLPVVSVIGLQAGALFAGAIIIEQVYNWPGLNLLLLRAIVHRDYPLILGSVLLSSAIFVFINLLTDLSYGFLDPRTRRD